MRDHDRLLGAVMGLGYEMLSEAMRGLMHQESTRRLMCCDVLRCATICHEMCHVVLRCAMLRHGLLRCAMMRHDGL